MGKTLSYRDSCHEEKMLSVDEARKQILSFFTVLEPEEKLVLESLEQVLAVDVVSRIDIPPLDNSAMDGYALRACDLQSASLSTPTVLKVVGSLAAGQLPEVGVLSGEAIRIMTGAPIPPGADAVVPFEDTDETARSRAGIPIQEIGIQILVDSGFNVRPAGRDIRRGDRVLGRGALLRPPEIGVLASLGYKTVSVYRRPTVGVIATGDELSAPGHDLLEGKIYDSNSYSIGSGIIRAGGIPNLLGIAGDDRDDLMDKIELGLTTDMLITSAGVSKGDYDIVKDVLAQRGKIDFWSVRMRPAKPLAFGHIENSDGRRVPHLGLPGNPVSALVAFEQFGRAAIHKMMGQADHSLPTIQAILEDPIVNDDSRRVFARVVVTRRDGKYFARVNGEQGSNLLTSMIRANGLAICPEEIPRKNVGDTVEVQMVDWPESVF